MYLNGFIAVEEGMSLSEIKVLVNEAFQESNALDIIDSEVKKTKELQKSGELPAFRFHLTENWVECPLTNVKLYLKKRG